MQQLTGLIGWRGMVGSVLLERMEAEGDFDLIEPLFFSTSDKGGSAPRQAKNETRLQDAYDIEQLKRCPILVTAQGGDYTKDVYPRLRAAGWNGVWIDAAKTLRMQDDAVIVLDPVNLGVIQDALNRGVRNFIGGNCTVSCMLMGVGGALQGRSRRVDDLHHLPGRVGRRRAAHARAVDAVRHAQRRGQGAARRSEVGHPRDRPPHRRTAARHVGCRDPPTSACRSAAA